MTAVIIVWLCAGAIAETTIDVESGYDGRYRAGRWSPIVVTVSSDSPRSAVLELRVPTASETIINIRQEIGIGIEKQRYVLYAPLALIYDPLRATLRDPRSGKVMAEYPDRDITTIDRGNDQVGYMIVTAGTSPAMQNLQRTNATGGTVVAHIKQQLLPAAPIGYDAIDVLFLNHPQWSGITIEQQNAIIAWVRTGGVLMVQPGVEPIPSDMPIASIMPGTLGPTETISLNAAERKDLGLSDRFSQIGIRPITPNGNVEKLPQFYGRTGVVMHDVGLGRVAIVPYDASTLQFNDSVRYQTFWNTVLEFITPAQPKQNANNWVSTPDQIAAHAALDRIGDIPNTGAFGFSYIAFTVGALMLIVGPIDFFVLKKIGRQPWTWATTIGWIGLATTGALYAGHLLRSGDLHYRTLRLIDQADGRVVGIEDVALIYAPRSASYAINSDPNVWWQPVPSGTHFSSSDSMTLPVETEQDYRGNRTGEMWIDVWNWKFLRGSRYVDQAGMIEAKLAVEGERVRGTIKNLSDRPLESLHVKVRDWSLDVPRSLAAGETRTINISAASPPKPEEEAAESANQIYPAQRAEPEGPPNYESLFGVSGARQTAVDRIMMGNKTIAVYATMKDQPTDVVIRNPGAIEQHTTLIRALFPLEGK